MSGFMKERPSQGFLVRHRFTLGAIGAILLLALALLLKPASKDGGLEGQSLEEWTASDSWETAQGGEATATSPRARSAFREIADMSERLGKKDSIALARKAGGNMPLPKVEPFSLPATGSGPDGTSDGSLKPKESFFEKNPSLSHAGPGGPSASNSGVQREDPAGRRVLETTSTLSKAAGSRSKSANRTSTLSLRGGGGRGGVSNLSAFGNRASGGPVAGGDVRGEGPSFGASGQGTTAALSGAGSAGNPDAAPGATAGAGEDGGGETGPDAGPKVAPGGKDAKKDGGGPAEGAKVSACFAGFTGERATACAAYQCAQKKSQGFSGQIGAISDGSAGAVRGLLSLVSADVDKALAIESGRQAKLGSQTYSCYGCEALNKCASNAGAEVREIVAALNQEKAKVQNGIGCAGAAGCKSVVMGARGFELNPVASSIQDHLRSVMTQTFWCANQVPDTMPGPPDKDGKATTVSNPQGQKEKQRFLGAAEASVADQEAVFAIVSPDWCLRHAGACSAPAVAASIRKLRGDQDWLGSQQQLRGEVPGNIMGAVDTTDAHLRKAEASLQGGVNLSQFLDGVDQARMANESFTPTPPKWDPHISRACAQ